MAWGQKDNIIKLFS